jgi:hypothetical protein
MALLACSTPRDIVNRGLGRLMFTTIEIVGGRGDFSAHIFL